MPFFSNNALLGAAGATGSVEFNGIRQWLDCPYILSGDWTISMFVKRLSDKTGYLANQWADKAAGRLVFFESDGSVDALFGSTAVGSTAILTDTWAHLALTKSGSQLAYYRDGSPVGTATNSNTITQLTWQMGGTNRFSNRMTNTRMSDARLYPRALVADDVLRLSNGNVVSGDGPDAWWRFAEQSGYAAADSSGNGNDAFFRLPTSDWVASTFGDYVFAITSYGSTYQLAIGELDYISDGQYSWVGRGYNGEGTNNLYVEVPSNVGVNANSAPSFMSYLSANPITLTDQFPTWSTDSPL